MSVNTIINLQENISSYGINGSKVTGHVTLSSPGIIRCYVQNFKKPTNDQIFAFYGFSKIHNKGIRIGQLGDTKETRWIVDGKNIMESGLKLEDIDGVAVVIEDKSRGSDAVLIGFSGNRYMINAILDDMVSERPWKKPGSGPNKPPQQGPGPVMPPKPGPGPNKPPKPGPGPMMPPKPGPGPMMPPKPGPGPMMPPQQGPGPVMPPKPGPGPNKPPQQGPGPVIPPKPGPMMPPQQGPGPVIPPKPCPRPEETQDLVEQPDTKRQDTQLPLEPGPVILPSGANVYQSTDEEEDENIPMGTMQGQSNVGQTGTIQGQSNMGQMGSMQGQSNMGQMGSMQGQSNMGQMGSMQGQSNMGQMGSMQGQSNMGQMGTMQGQANVGQVGSMQGQPNMDQMGTMQGQNNMGQMQNQPSNDQSGMMGNNNTYNNIDQLGWQNPVCNNQSKAGWQNQSGNNSQSANWQNQSGNIPQGTNWPNQSGNTSQSTSWKNQSGSNSQNTNWKNQPGNIPQSSNWQNQSGNIPQSSNWQNQSGNTSQGSNWTNQSGNTAQGSNWQNQPNNNMQGSSWQNQQGNTPQSSNWQNQSGNTVQGSNWTNQSGNTAQGSNWQNQAGNSQMTSNQGGTQQTTTNKKPIITPADQTTQTIPMRPQVDNVNVIKHLEGKVEPEKKPAISKAVGSGIPAASVGVPPASVVREEIEINHISVEDIKAVIQSFYKDEAERTRDIDEKVLRISKALKIANEVEASKIQHEKRIDVNHMSHRNFPYEQNEENESIDTTPKHALEAMSYMKDNKFETYFKKKIHDLSDQLSFEENKGMDEERKPSVASEEVGEEHVDYLEEIERRLSAIKNRLRDINEDQDSKK